MIRFVYRLIAKVTGKNPKSMPLGELLGQLEESRPLPMGRKEFEEWSDRIISGALVPGATPESLKYALANQLMHLPPTQDHESDAYFIKLLRKFAVNQVADVMRRELFELGKQKAAEQEAALKAVNQ